MGKTKSGDRVRIHYTGRLDDGSVFDSSEGREPLEFTAGGDEVIAGMSQAVLGMAEGETKTIRLAAEEAYGPRQPELAQRVPREMLPDEVEVGQPLQAQTEDQTIVVWVAELGDDFAVVDANHPLAGRDLTFDIEMVSVQAAEG